jgi:DNA-binding CsgD family transcriptional regulator
MAWEAIASAERRRSAHQLACALVATAEALLYLGRPTEARAAIDRIGDGAYGFVGQRSRALRARSLLAMGAHGEAAVVLQRLLLDQHTIVAHAEGIAAGIEGPVTSDDITAWAPPPWRSAERIHHDAVAILTRGAQSRAGAPMATRSTAAPTVGRSAAADRVAAAHGLSDREAEALRALLVDQPLALVATQLGISPNTLKTHLRRTYRKLGVSSRDEAVELVARAELDPS